MPRKYGRALVGYLSLFRPASMRPGRMPRKYVEPFGGMGAVLLALQ